jgi:hypothetical protein
VSESSTCCLSEPIAGRVKPYIFTDRFCMRALAFACPCKITDVGYGLDPQLAPKIMDPSGKFFDSGPGRAHAMISGWESIGKPAGMELWVGEIAAAWHSGEPGVTNRFISSFWYADALGLLATINHTGFCRQTLIGGNCMSQSPPSHIYSSSRARARQAALLGMARCRWPTQPNDGATQSRLFYGPDVSR